MARGALLVAGATSDAGKSVLTAGICRWLRRQGVAVAPFKAQNMSNNSVVTPDGAEIGRAQGAQAAACGLEPEAAMNPVLLKPGRSQDGRMISHVVLMGRPLTEVGATDYPRLHRRLKAAVLDAFDDLCSRYDVVVCEGAGGAAEVNLRGHDLANLGLASARDLPVVIVADIDRGGAFASLFGTLALLDASDQRLVSGFVINRFRGERRLLDPGPQMLERVTGRPVLGVVPWTGGLALDAEDSLALDAPLPRGADPMGLDPLTVAVVRLPQTSNATDVDALACEPGVRVSWTTSADRLRDADLVVLPGTRATVADLEWLRGQRISEVVLERVARNRPVLGICGGYQMLARTITDLVESGVGQVAGLGLLPTAVVFEPSKTVHRVTGTGYGHPVTTGYEIRHGRVEVAAAAAVDAFPGGCRVGAVWGTTWHGALESDAFRRAFLTEVAGVAGREFTVAPNTDLAALREARLEALADLVVGHLDTAALMSLIQEGPPAGLPFIPPGAPAFS